jgi:hypothetical protein
LSSLLRTFESCLALQLIDEVLEERRSILLDTGSTPGAYFVGIYQVFTVAQAMDRSMDIPDCAVKQRALEELRPVSKQQESHFQCASQDAQEEAKRTRTTAHV